MSRHVLLLVNTYVTEKDPRRGAKFRLHLKAYKDRGLKVGLVAFMQRDISLLKCLSRGGLILEEEAYGAPVIRNCAYWALPIRSLFWRSEADAAKQLGFRTLQRYVKLHGRPDLVHAHGSHWGGIAAKVAHERLGIPYVVTEHMTRYASGMVDPKNMPLMRDVFASARMRMPIGESTGQLLERTFGADFCPWQVVPNMVDDTLFSRHAEREPLEQRPFVFVSAGRFDRIKGFDILLESFAAQFKGQNVLLRIGGAGQEERELKTLSANLGLEKQVEFLGSLSREQVGEELRRADAYVLASRHETFGVPVVEAHASGLPVLATRCGVHEKLIDETNGLWVEPENVEALARGMRSMIDRISDFNRDAIREKCLATYAPNAVLDLLETIYDDALQEHAA